MNIYRYQVTFCDDTNEFGISFGVSESDVMNYLMGTYREFAYGVRSCNVFQADDMSYPEMNEVPCHE